MLADGMEGEAEAEGLLPELSERTCYSQMGKPERLLGEGRKYLEGVCGMNVFIISLLFSLFIFLPFAHASEYCSGLTRAVLW